MRLFKLIIVALLAVCTGCTKQTKDCPKYDAQWVMNQADGVDVFYVISANVWSDSTCYASLTADQRDAMTKEMDYVRNALGDSVNFFSPYYHQLTLSSFLVTDSVEIWMNAVKREIQDAFTFYMDHLNQGRPFVLMGFSEGAMLVLDLTKHLTHQQYQKLVATYMLGYRLAQEDTICPTVCPASDATTPGVTVSFNTVTDTTAVWPMLTDGAVTCINPLTWRTDDTPSEFAYEGDTSLVYVDTNIHVLLAPDIDKENYYRDSFKPFCKEGNLHLGDLLFYLPMVKENIHVRTQFF